MYMHGFNDSWLTTNKYIEFCFLEEEEDSRIMLILYSKVHLFLSNIASFAIY